MAMTAFVAFVSVFHFLFTFVAINGIFKRHAWPLPAPLRIHFFESCHLLKLYNRRSNHALLTRPPAPHFLDEYHLKYPYLLCSCSTFGSHMARCGKATQHAIHPLWLPYIPMLTENDFKVPTHNSQVHTEHCIYVANRPQPALLHSCQRLYR